MPRAHWIYLSRCLFNLTGDPKYVDAIETSLLNHLLSSQSPWSAYQSYYLPLIGRKRYNRPSLHSNEPPCCVSSVHRVMAEIPEVVWTRSATNGMAILIYTAGRLSASVRTDSGVETRVAVEMKTDYPASGSVVILVDVEEPTAFRLLLRVPGWTTRFAATCGGRTVRGQPGEFMELNRRWRSGDTVKISMDMPVVVLSGAPKYDGFYAIRRGPMVLSVGADVNPDFDIDAVRIAAARKPVLNPAEDRLPKNWIGMAYLAASRLGKRAGVLVDLGHHALGANIEQITAVLLSEKKFGGFHFNDKKYGDDDLTVGSVQPYQLFLVFCELVDAERDPALREHVRSVRLMIDENHNIKNQIEGTIQSVMALQSAYAKALLVDYAALGKARGEGNIIDAEECLKSACETDVRPILAELRTDTRLDPDPLGAFRRSGYTQRMAKERGGRQ